MCLKMFLECVQWTNLLRSAGSLFQKRGPATQKELNPNFSPVYLGSSNKFTAKNMSVNMYLK